MHFKIVNTNPNWVPADEKHKYPKVLLYIDKDDDMNVIITAAGYELGTSAIYVTSEEVKFDNSDAPKRFIETFNQIAAVKFCYRNGIIAIADEYYEDLNDEKE